MRVGCLRTGALLTGVLGALACVASASVAFGQAKPVAMAPASTAPAEAPPPTRQSAEEAAANAGPVVGANASGDLPEGILRDVSDPMLTPVPRARSELVRWQDALETTRKRSTNL